MVAVQRNGRLTTLTLARGLRTDILDWTNEDCSCILVPEVYSARENFILSSTSPWVGLYKSTAADSYSHSPEVVDKVSHYITLTHLLFILMPFLLQFRKYFIHSYSDQSIALHGLRSKALFSRTTGFNNRIKKTESCLKITIEKTS